MLITAVSGTAVLLCESFGALQGRCRVQPVEVLPAQEMHAEVSFDVSFPCRGHQLGLVLASDEGRVAVPFGDATLKLKGFGPFRFADADPDKTYRASLQGACQPVIARADAQPSLETLRLWHEQASGQARVLAARLDSYRRLKDLQRVVTWDDEQLHATKERVTELLAAALPPDLRYEDLIDAEGRMKDAAAMPAGWAMAVILHPEIPDLVALRAQVESILAGRPPVYDPAAVDAEARVLAAEVATARTILARAEPWMARLTAEARAAMARLAQLVREGQA